ncbi:SPFH domain-containing protein [Anaerocolumna xylanovorans]|uniref:Membrane protease subunit, stomatin/prohibitin family, contains C-terminal Zn-ribbon domain n=1 Tax=Anaerocolumna xylanovorans DSM 12503 TaxID=1121345 RepID=A0A1M7YNP6_9FIRM|nr:SPFH domain-containing protein [Anaerocolumna xylanovorans]SHO54283.1 Membrane protease subunit, stomatin/prohibitin family, contains C-terminal Zn-ribbon domain [Anaerocolumna xylanovorans DSM 12503]
MALLDVVRFNGLKNRDWIIYKYPSDQLVFGTQLIVQEGQAAIFVKNGTVCDAFYPGTFMLSTENLPLLNKLINLPFGGKTPFSAEVYFLNTTTKLDINWGTTDPIQLIDPKYFVRLRIRAFGQMGLKLQDYTMFFEELIGGMNQDDLVKYDKIKEFYRGLIVIKVKSIISTTIISEKISALEISTKLEALSQHTQLQITEEFEKYGFKVVNFYIQSINFPDEDFEKINKILEDKAAFELMGDNRYSTKRSFDVYEGAANNQNGVAGAFAAGGLGFGTAMSINNGMNSTLGGASVKICPACHAQNSIKTNFCSECGEVLKEKVQEEMIQCPACNKSIHSKSKYCPECGFDLGSLICECGYKLDLNSKFCPECGKKVNIHRSEEI